VCESLAGVGGFNKVHTLVSDESRKCRTSVLCKVQIVTVVMFQIIVFRFKDLCVLGVEYSSFGGTYTAIFASALKMEAV
jgi:hypothetical protein